MLKITYSPIGTISSPFSSLEDTPIQPTAAKGIRGKITLFEEFQEGLNDIEGFSHLILLYHLHLSTGYSLKVVPFLDTAEHGIFATRYFNRPNPIGMSVVKLIERQSNTLIIEDVDIVDGTPLLDIKPYVFMFDARSNVKSGWVENKTFNNIVDKNLKSKP